jgi:PPOX class probable F420-dependent enzyme
VRLNGARARELFAAARVARLATVTADGRPHAVPIVFALDGDVLYTAVDAKPKSTTALRRLANIAANPSVAVLADHYADDWTQLWWVRADGAARIIAGADADAGLQLLTDRYPQYRSAPPPGPVIAIRVERWTGWQAAGYRDRP